uniref:Uncharacterized protein n=1 Tax=Leersia perrieri TaxID=77586 RepID=A0A0D9WS52_9ORYZ
MPPLGSEAALPSPGWPDRAVAAPGPPDLAATALGAARRRRAAAMTVDILQLAAPASTVAQ